MPTSHFPPLPLFSLLSLSQLTAFASAYSQYTVPEPVKLWHYTRERESHKSQKFSVFPSLVASENGRLHTFIEVLPSSCAVIERADFQSAFRLALVLYPQILNFSLFLLFSLALSVSLLHILFELLRQQRVTSLFLGFGGSDR